MDAGQEEGGGQGSFVSFSEEKETKEQAASFSFVSSASPIPSFRPTPPSLSLSLSGSGSILPSLLEERKRPGLLHLLLQGKGVGGARGAPLLRVVVVTAPSVLLVPLLRPLLSTPLATPPPPPSRGVYCCIAQHVDCCVVAFRLSPRAPSALLPLFRCVVGQSSARSLASSSERLVVTYV